MIHTFGLVTPLVTPLFDLVLMSNTAYDMNLVIVTCPCFFNVSSHRLLVPDEMLFLPDDVFRLIFTHSVPPALSAHA